MGSAEELFTVHVKLVWLLKLLLDPVSTVKGDAQSSMACPACKRVYGELPSFSVLNAQRAVVKCPCGKVHLGYKPFSGYY